MQYTCMDIKIVCRMNKMQIKFFFLKKKQTPSLISIQENESLNLRTDCRTGETDYNHDTRYVFSKSVDLIICIFYSGTRPAAKMLLVG